MQDLNCKCALARCYAQGIGTRKNRKKALELCREILSKEYSYGELEDFGTREELEATRLLMEELDTGK